MQAIGWYAGLATALSLWASAAWADSQRMGWVEKLRMAPAGIPLKAKLDTGALTSSLHATEIELFERDDDTWVRFTLDVEDADGAQHSLRLERPKVRGVRIKEHEGEYDRRPVVMMQFCLAGQWREAQFTLADRSRFIYPVLLGRRFLGGVAIVDPSATFITDARCSKRPS
jgi:hypothetical protein